MFNTNKKRIKKLKKKMAHIEKIVSANNEFLNEIYEVMRTVAAEPEAEEPKNQIGFTIPKQKQDD